MEPQSKSARSKQKRRSAIAVEQVDTKMRRPIATLNKRGLVRFAKGPSETGGFQYPRRRVLISETLDLEPVISPFQASPIIADTKPLAELTLEPLTPKTNEDVPVAQILEQVEELAKKVPDENIQETNETQQVAEIVEETADIPLESVETSPEPETIEVDELANKIEESLDNTVGPGDARSSDSESSEEEESEVEEIVKPVIVPMVAKQPLTKPNPPTPVVRKPISPVSRKVVTVVPAASVVVNPVKAPRSSWSKFLPLVIEIKATIPYPMHLLGLFLVLVTGFLLRSLYQFGADLAGEMELQNQLVRIAKLVFLFVVVVVCVNMVEENKDEKQLLHEQQQQQDVLTFPVPQHKTKHRSRAAKNKKKPTMKV